MQALMPWLSILIVCFTGYMLIKRAQTHMVLLLSGLAMILLAISFGVTDFLPKGVKPSGFVGFDIFELLSNITAKQISGIGLLIMTCGGFAGYMDRVGAANSLVKICIDPLRRLSQPYLLLAISYVIGQILCLVLPSAAGLAMLLLVALFPILRGVGVSAAAAAAVIGTTAGIGFAPTAGTANLAAKVAGLEPIIYFVKYQLPIAVPVILMVAVAHFFVQRYYDRRNDDVYGEALQAKAADANPAPLWYAIFPVLPIVLLIIFSKLVYKAVNLSTIAALLLVWVLVMIIELLRRKGDYKKVFADSMVFYKKMGAMFAGIVSLIICAEFFAAGLKATGVVALLISSAHSTGFGMGGFSLVLAVIVGLVTFLTGSGVGAFSSFAALAPDVANGLGGSATALVTPMQFTGGIIRAMSPVAGVIIAVAGTAGVSPIAVVRRTWLPMLLAMALTVILNWFLFI